MGDKLTRLRPNGAEEAAYRAAGLPWGPKNAPFETVEELQQVLGMTADIYKRVAPSLTTYSGEAGRFFGVPDKVFSIHATAERPDGANSVREAVVQLIGADARVLLWREGAS